MLNDKLKPFIFPIILLLIGIVFTVFRVNGSSVGMYNLFFYGPNFHDPDLLYGHPRGIRSDEWLCLTPWTVSQAQNGFNPANSFFLAGQEFGTTDAPVNSWTTVFRPQNWSFFALPLEQAFAFKWWFNIFFLAVAVYCLAMMLTNGRILLAVIAALSFVFSPFVQWWLTTNVTEAVAFSILIFLFFVQMVNNPGNPRRLWLNASALTYFSICFAITLYPPFQVPLVLFFGFLGTGYFLSKRQELEKVNLRALAISMMICLMVVGVVLVLFFVTNKSVILAMANTAYPGARQAVGAEDGFFLKALGGFYNIQLLDHANQVPNLFENQSEASSFFFFSVFLLPFYLFFLFRSILRRERLDLPLVFSLLCFVIMLTWGIIGLPAWLAKVLLLTYVPPKRMLLGLGLINHVLILHYLFRFKINQTVVYKIIAALYALGTFIILVQMGEYIKANWPVYLSSDLEIFLIACAVGAMMLLLLYQKKMAFLILFLAFTLVSTFFVHPLYRGLAPLRDARLMGAFADIKKKDPAAGWVVYDNLIFSDYLASNGLHTLNGTYYSPNIDFWSRFDRKHKYIDIYNRYEHLIVSYAAEGEKSSFYLQHEDAVQMKISPCDPLLQKMGVKYHLFVSADPVYSCLSLIKKIEYPTQTFYLYERTP